MNKPRSIIVAGFAALVATGCVNREAQQQAKQTAAIVQDPVKVVSVQPVGTQAVSETLEISGQMVTADDVQIGAKQSGRLAGVLVRDGDSVYAGQLLAFTDSSQANAQFRQALGQLASAQSQLSQAINNATIAPTKSRAAVRQAEAAVRVAKEQLRSAEANLKKVLAGARSEERAQAKANVEAAKASLDQAQKNLNRITTLVAEGALPQSQLDTAQAQYANALTAYENALQVQAMQVNGARPEDIEIARTAVATAQQTVAQAEEGVRAARANQRLDVLLNDAVRTAQAQVSAAQAQVDVARVAVSDTQIRSPFSGRVSGRPLQTGTVVSPGMTIVRVVGGQGSYFEGQVPESGVRFVTVGKPVKVSVDALPGQVFNGAVLAVSPAGSEVGRQFTVRISVGGQTGGLRPGMFAKGVVDLRTVPNAMVVPSTAVVRRDNKDVVFLMIDGKAKQTPVTKGIEQGSIVEVVGLKIGDPVIVQGQTDLDEGAKVKLPEPKASPSPSAAPAGGK